MIATDLRAPDNLAAAMARLRELETIGAEARAASIRAAIVEAHRPLVLDAVGRRYRGRVDLGGLPYDDAVQVAMLGLYDALRRYDPARAAFSTYAYHWIRNRLTRAMHAENVVSVPEYCWRRLRAVALDEPDSAGRPLVEDLAADDPGPEAALLDVAATAAGRDALAHLDALPEPDRTVLRLRFVEGRTLAEIGDWLGRSRERARQIQERALNRLRAALGLAERVLPWERRDLYDA